MGSECHCEFSKTYRIRLYLSILLIINPMNFFSSHLAQDWIPNIKMIATDMDGTLTHYGRLSPLLLERLERLRDRGIPVLIVTGRSAGWVSALVEYLPVAGAIAENGGDLFTPDQPQGIPITNVRAITPPPKLPRPLPQSQSRSYPAGGTDCPSGDRGVRRRGEPSRPSSPTDISRNSGIYNLWPNLSR
jgi:hypothetical protein